MEILNISIDYQRSWGMKHQPSEIINFYEQLHKQSFKTASPHTPFLGEGIQIKPGYNT